MSQMEAAVFISIRLAVMILAGPPLGGRAVPSIVRFIFVMTLSVVLSQWIYLDARGTIHTSWVAALTQEVFVGLSLGVGMSLAAGAFQLGAKLVDIQIGFGMSQVLDASSSQVSMPTLAALMNQIGIVVFLIMDGLLILLQSVAMSIKYIPPGVVEYELNIEMMIFLCWKMGALGFAALVPVISALFLVDLGLGLMARSLPQMNVLFLGMPLKAAVGIFLLSVWSLSATDGLRSIYKVLFFYWSGLWA